MANVEREIYVTGMNTGVFMTKTTTGDEMIKLTAKYEYKTDTGRKINIGDKLTYRGHIPGGWVMVEFPDGHEEPTHPKVYEELQ